MAPRAQNFLKTQVHVISGNNYPKKSNPPTGIPKKSDPPYRNTPKNNDPPSLICCPPKVISNERSLRSMCAHPPALKGNQVYMFYYINTELYFSFLYNNACKIPTEMCPSSIDRTNQFFNRTILDLTPFIYREFELRLPRTEVEEVDQLRDHWQELLQLAEEVSHNLLKERRNAFEQELDKQVKVCNVKI